MTIQTYLDSDRELVERSLRGDRAAFGHIVERYQSLICALTYSATGDISRSEDLAQETFLAAWRGLDGIKEPERLKSWLCGIARHIVQEFHRRSIRDPLRRAGSLDAAELENAARSFVDGDPRVGKEAQALLWRVLEGLPDSYREPLVLFYRQDQSVAEVAGVLGISEDAVRQRLSRGRAMLSERVSGFVESALCHSGPKGDFALCVIAALPALTATASSAAAGTAGAASKASAGAAAKSAGLLGTLGPLGMILSIFFGYKLDSDDASSPQGHKMVAKFYRILVTYIVVFTLAVLSLMLTGWPMARSHPRWFAGLAVGLGLAYVVACLTLLLWMQQRKRRIREQEIAEGRTVPLLVPLFEYRSKLRLFGWPLVHIRIRGGLERGPVKAWIAAGDAAIGLIFAFGAVAVAPFSFGGLAVGLLTVGGMAFGMISFGGFSFGPWALGALAFGWRAYGCVAVAWSAAQGAVAVARDYAMGLVALAQHANDVSAEAFFRDTIFFQAMPSVMRHAEWLYLLCLLGPAMWWWRRKKSKSNYSRLN